MNKILNFLACTYKSQNLRTVSKILRHRMKVRRLHLETLPAQYADSVDFKGGLLNYRVFTKAGQGMI